MRDEEYKLAKIFYEAGKDLGDELDFEEVLEKIDTSASEEELIQE